ncbi:MAG: hypothetical protein RLZZ299_2960 [Pseudomonadota bacterium]
MPLHALIALLVACTGTDPADGTRPEDADTAGDAPVDRDRDGVPDAQDCDPEDPNVHAGAPDAPYDGVDADCAGGEEFDLDGDGIPGGPDGLDCDDTRADRYPGAAEACDGADNDCDSEIDEIDGRPPLTLWLDNDGDGHGSGDPIESACPGDLTGLSTVGDDCDDTDGAVYPGAAELCDGRDENCDGTADAGALDAPAWHADRDGDGFGAEAVTRACAAPDGHVADGTDCDDADDQSFPGAEEVCDTRDNDCDGAADEDAAGEVPRTWYADADGDGVGTTSSVVAVCAPPGGYAASAGDCDDADGTVHPGAFEHCDGRDEDCSGAVDEDATDASDWYPDLDGDGYGDTDAAVRACAPPAGAVAEGGDCDDAAAAVHPGAVEVCGGADEDCDGLVDESTASGASRFYQDLDGDGHGTPLALVTACAAPAGWAVADDDCDDSSARAFPGASERCDDEDNDCDGDVDEADAVDPRTWYADADADGFGHAATTQVACEAPAGFVASRSDCDDARAGVNPLGTEVCMNLRDDDCSEYDALGAWVPRAWDAQLDACDTLAGTAYTLDGTAPSWDVAIAGQAVGAGVSGGDRFGGQLAGGGDLDGDGRGDLVVAAFQADNAPSSPTVNDVGAVYWFRGALAAGSGIATATTGQPGSYRLKILGGTANEQIGYSAGSIAIAPDVTGDAQDDLVVGSPQLGSGKAYVFSGAALAAAGVGSTITTASAAATLTLGGTGSAQEGWAVAPAGDVNGDGFQDLLVGSPSNQSNLGRAGLYFGGVRSWTGAMVPNVLLQGSAVGTYLAANQKLGSAVAGLGDFDGDGFDDVVAGMPYSTAQGTQTYPPPTNHLAQGAVALLYGSAMADIPANPAAVPTAGSPAFVTAASAAVLVGERPYDRFGNAVSRVGDQDLDGYDDLLIGADLYGHTTDCVTIACEKGRAYLVNGGVVSASGSGNANRRLPAGSVSSAALVANATFDPVTSTDQEFFGRSVRGGDFNHDRYGDVVIGVTQGGTNGFAYLFYGPIADGAYTNPDATANLKITGTLASGEAGNTFGSPIGTPGDVNGDGIEDLLFGHMTYNGGGGATGRAYVFFGRGE